MPHTMVVSAAARVDDTSVTPNLLVATGALADEQNSLDEFASISFVLAPGVLFGAPLTLDLSIYTAKSLYIVSDQPFQMKIGAGVDIHKIRKCFLMTFGAGEPAQLLFATGTGVADDANIKVILGSVN
jgi:hypothetical protein